MPTKFFTNQNDNSLLKKFEGVFTHGEAIRYFDALVGYFRASGYFKVRPFLDKIPQIRILVGINVDQITKNYHDRGQLYIANPNTTKDAFVKDMVVNIQDAHYDSAIEKGIIQFITDLTDGKIELRAHPKQKIHAKVYIMRPENFNEHAPCEVITGSSNMTDSGLGTFEESNYEFNVSLRDFEDVKFATDEFERLWQESIPILNADAQLIKNKTYLKDDYTPFELYIKMLKEYFGRRVEYDPYNIDLLLPDKFMRLKYQSDAANQGYAIMMKHNGFILADVVGLGKTIVACMVIKKFIYENGTHTRILLVVPPAIEASWVKTIEEFQIKSHFEWVTLGSLHKVLDTHNNSFSTPDKYDLIVVDESHKFRNDYTDMYVKLQQICKTPRSRAAENGDTKKKVILMSATPLNNRPQDIENQLYLFQDKRNSTLEGVRNLQEYFKPKNDLYEELASAPRLDVQRLKDLFREIRNDVIEPLVIRRTRTDIANSVDYLADLKSQGIKFPNVSDPIPLYYKLNAQLSQLFVETIDLITAIDEDGNITEGVGYFRYRAIEFLEKEEDRKIYGNVKSISKRLSVIMRTLLVKRLESSFHAFKQSLFRLQKAIDNMIQMFEKDTIFIAPDLDINKLLEEGLSYDAIETKINERQGNNRTFKAADFDKAFLGYLKKDKEKVDKLSNQWAKIREDPKLNEFMKYIRNTFFKKEINIAGKLVIFTESKETADTLTEAVIANGYKALSVSSENRKELEATIRDNFDANYEETHWKNDYDIIITTEVLAEGINLHRSNVIVNYDVPWNATRLMQRIGRVNRIGSRADAIVVYNFYPSADGDAYIKLVNKALRKLQAFHSAFGEDNRIFSLLEEKGDGALFGNHIQREESEILKYLIELREFKKNNKAWFDEIVKIPHKARCGRDAEAVTEPILVTTENDAIRYPLPLTSLSYFKSDNHPGIFCLVTPELTILELSFLEAVEVFKAKETEKAIAIHQLHHEQALKGLDFFQNGKIQERIQPISRKALSPIENKAISNINAMLQPANTPQKRAVLRRVMDKIKEGAFAAKGLPKEINDFFTNQVPKVKNPETLLDLLFTTVLDKYDFSPSSNNAEIEGENTPLSIINPKIVLTLSFN